MCCTPQFFPDFCEIVKWCVERGGIRAGDEEDREEQETDRAS